MSTGTRARLRRAAIGVATGLGVVAAGYAVLVGRAWARYGHAAQPGPDETSDLLDQFMPSYEVVERHHARVAAPAEITLAAAMEADMQGSPIVQAIFRARELVLGAEARPRSARGLLAEVQSIGWRVLAERPGREIVVGAVTQPWLADVEFRGLPPDAFRDFREPGYVKIVWNLRVDAAGPAESIFRTETRVMTTDSTARSRFRWYWARFSPGIALIRQVLVASLKQEAERRVRLAGERNSG